MNKQTVKITAGVIILGIFAFNIIKDHREAVKKGLTFELDRLNSAHLYGYVYDTGMAFRPEIENNGKMRRLAGYYGTLSKYLPDSPEAKGLSGFAHYHTGEFKKAYEAYRQAAQLDPAFFWYHHNLAALLVKAGETRQAVQACRRAVSTDPKYVMDKIVASRRIYFPLLLAKITDHLRNCRGHECKEPRDRMMELFAQVRDQISSGYQNCLEVIEQRDNQQRLLAISKTWPLAGF